MAYNKGGPFERRIAKELSLWLSGGKDDSLVWRSSQSGGRATTRAKRGKKTAGHCGDLCATDPKVSWFFKLFTVECKSGYASYTPMDLIDRTANASERRSFVTFVKQARDAADRAGTPYWMLIHHRPQRRTMVYVPVEFLNASDLPRTLIESPQVSVWVNNEPGYWGLAGLVLKSFFHLVDPGDIRPRPKKSR